MKTTLRSLVGLGLALALLMPATADASTLRGKLVNRTTGGVGTADAVRLLDVAQGMDPIQTLENVTGDFVLENVPETAAHLLLQIERDGITYNQSVPATEGDAPIEIDVFDTGTDISALDVSIHHVLFQRNGDHLTVTELYEFSNASDPPVAIPGSVGAVKMHIPHAVHGEIEASVGTTSMPIRLPVTETSEAGVFMVDTSLRPGTTRVLLRYMLSYEEQHLQWDVNALYAETDRRVLVSPPDVSVEAENMIATESQMEGFAAYAGLPITAGESWRVHLHGGSAQAADVGSGQAANNSPTDLARIAVRPNRLSESKVIILIGLPLFLITGLMLGITTGPKSKASSQSLDPAEEKKRARISKLADRYISGEIDRDHFERERDHILGIKSRGGPTHGAGSAAPQTAGH